MVPLKVAHLPGVERVAATSGLIISAAAVCGTISAGLAGRLGHALAARPAPPRRLPRGRRAMRADGMDRRRALAAFPALACGLCLGGALTLAYSLAALKLSATRGAAFGWLALGVQVGTALSPLATGGPGGAEPARRLRLRRRAGLGGGGLLLFGARGLLARRD